MTAAVVGPGAVGCAVAAAVRGDVVLCARRPLAAVEVRYGGREAVTLDAPVVTSAEAVAGAVEWVLLAVKAHQTAGAEHWLRALVGPATTVVVLQNGVEHAEQLAGIVAQEQVLPTVQWCGADASRDGVVAVQPGCRLVVPRGARGEAFARLLRDDLIRVELTGDVVAAAWEKLCANVPTALQALTSRAAEVYAEPGVAAVAERLAEECAAVARAAGVTLPDGLARRVVDEARALPPDAGSSILADRLAGRPLEWEARNGVVSRRGAELGVPTPVTDTVVALLAAVG